MSMQSEDGEANIESGPQQFLQIRYRRNLVISPLLRLPAELIVKIFEHAIELDNYNHLSPSGSRPVMLVLVAVCQELRNIGMAAPLLWSTVDLTVPYLAELYLQQCNYDPHTLKRSLPLPENQLVRLIQGPRREAVWTQLEGRTFNNLRSLVFEGTLSELKHRIVPILQTATNISNLDLRQPTDSASQLPWHSTSPTPHLSTLRLYGFSINWTSPLLRNLTQLTLDLGQMPPLTQHTPIETVLAALDSCPDLELLKLVRTGPSPLNGYRDECGVVVRLGRLRELFLHFEHAPTIGYILSHIRYPESTHLEVVVSISYNSDASETISQILPHNNPAVLLQFQTTRELTIRLDIYSSTFSTNKSTISCWHWAPGNSFQMVHQATQKVLEIVGKDVVTLSIRARDVNLTGVMWRSILHRLPRLEKIGWWCGKRQYPGAADPFIFAFSLPFEGGLVCPRLSHLELSREMVTQHPSATLLKQILTERNVCGVRLKWMGLSDDTTGCELRDEPVLEQFRDLVDEVR